MRKYNVFYQGRIIHTNLTIEDCSEILQDFSERFYSGEDVDPNELKMEEILNG